MPRKAMVHRATRQLLMLDVRQGQPPPEGIEVDVIDLSDVEADKLATANASFSVDEEGVVTAHVINQPATPLRDAVVNTALSAVGVTLGNLTQGQRLALIACLLYRAGGLDPVTLAVRPLDQWVT